MICLTKSSLWIQNCQQRDSKINQLGYWSPNQRLHLQSIRTNFLNSSAFSSGTLTSIIKTITCSMRNHLNLFASPYYLPQPRTSSFFWLTVFPGEHIIHFQLQLSQSRICCLSMLKVISSIPDLLFNIEPHDPQLQLNRTHNMYYRRWTRMHLKPGLKYFMKYGVLHPKFDRFAYLMQTENPEPIQYRRNPLLKKNTDKDLDTKLINNLFLKYPDLQYEPISQNKFPGQPFNTFSYAYAFISEQKKLIRQGYSVAKAFELTEQKYHEKMQRKLDQSLLSRGLAFGNRAKSFLNVYQQQAEFESRMKTQRTQRELEKYDIKLNSIREAVESHDQQDLLDSDVLSYQRMFYSVRQHNRSINDNASVTPVGYTEIPKTDSKERFAFIDNVEKKFKHLFAMFYEHAATKDRLEGLTDAEIINQIQSSPSKLKRQTRQLIKYLESRNIKLSLQNGNIVVSGPNSDLISNEIKSNNYLKIALLSDSLNYEKPIYSSLENPTKNADAARDIFKYRSMLKDIRPEALTKEKKEAVQATKKKELDLVANQPLEFNREAYKILETQQERLLRLEVKYYDMLISQINANRNDLNEDQLSLGSSQRLQELQSKRSEAIQSFRRLKYRLENRYRSTSADELLFPEHEQIGNGINFESEVEYEELLGYLRRKNDDRRLTSLDQSKDNKISKAIRILEVSQGTIAEGTETSTQ